MMVLAATDWPDAPLTRRLVLDTLANLSRSVPLSITSIIPTDHNADRILQWQSYDSQNHDLTLSDSSRVLSSSYTIRKSLIRKHYLSRCISTYLTKHPGSLLKSGTPRTWEVEISWSDEIDEKWTDELWDLGVVLDENDRKEESERKWFILKPGMTDRGNGIRLLDSKESLQSIFEEWDDSDEEDGSQEDGVITNHPNGDEEDSDIGVLTSQLRYFVIQEYISNPLLIDPSQVPLSPSDTPSTKLQPSGHKFHLRAYVLARGALQVYLYTNILALFSSAPYHKPLSSGGSTYIDLTPHLTNTCLQPDHSEEHVRTLDELIGCSIVSSEEGENVLSKEDVESIKTRMGEILAEVFKAALENPVHFQRLPNAFELFGGDFLLSHPTTTSPAFPCPYVVTLLELNAEPAIEMTGQRLHWLLQGLFTGIGEVAVRPWLEGRDGKDGHTSEDWGMRMVLNVQVRGQGGW